MKAITACFACAALLGALTACQGPAGARTGAGSVIFIHPDGTGAAVWAAARALYVGPDSDLHWDRLPHMALYREHMTDTLTATSNAGGTTHAYGIKVPARSFGLEGETPIVDAGGQSLSVMQQALRRGMAVAVINSGTSTEPGTACFLTSVSKRENHEEIARQLLESGADIILGGGEQWFLPQGAAGRHGPGRRTDGRDLIAEARSRGYTVVFTRQELADLPPFTPRLLGLFAAYHTFNDLPEEELRARNLPAYWPDAPSVADMTAAALRLLERQGRPFLLMTEEEGTDNFGNVNNARDLLLAAKRADDAIGVARDYVRRHPDTLLLTAADSVAGGPHLLGIPTARYTAGAPLPARDANGAPIDGADGAETPAFVARPDRAGRALPFAIVWATLTDVSGGVLVRAEGLNAHLVRGSFDNTDIARVIRLTLLGDGKAPAPAR